ncbi:MAG TPA: hypothetical protein VMH35_19935 [Streptosporangiaceae bacterium]|nr:hypothetical protein [Streptosporangiaceae bacterium]
MRRAAIVTALAGIALLAACGGSHPAGSGTGTEQSLSAQLDAYASCVRHHGVTNFYFSPAGSNTSGITSTTPVIAIRQWVAPADPTSPQFQAAMTACNRLFPGGAPGPVTQRQKIQMLKFAACIRAHGYPSYPDPQFPSSGGVMQQASGIDTNSPQFQTAAKTCNGKS